MLFALRRAQCGGAKTLLRDIVVDVAATAVFAVPALWHVSLVGIWVIEAAEAEGIRVVEAGAATQPVWVIEAAGAPEGGGAGPRPRLCLRYVF